MRPRTAIASIAAVALIAALVVLFREAQRPAERAGAAGESVVTPERAEPGPASPEPAPPPDPERESSPERAGARTPAKTDAPESSPEPQIFVRPVPGAKVPDEISAESLADITVQRDAAPEGSEAARAQSVTRLYQQRRYDDALEEALSVLDDYPDNLAMRRTVVAISCTRRDAERAREHYAELTGWRRRRARSRCEKYGIELGK